jgi:NAD+ kinase
MSAKVTNVLLVAATGHQYQVAASLVPQLSKRLRSAGLQVTTDDTGDRYDLAVAIGGDGTMMKTVTDLAPRSIPTLGINAGDVGFLTSAEASEWEAVADRIVSGHYEVEKRLGLAIQAGAQAFGPIANEVVLRHPSSVGIYQIAIGAQVFYERLMGDGVMVATATGSTGYNTSAGGPILLPSSGNVVVTPLNPMSLSTRSIVSQELAEGKDITITLVESKRNEPAQVIYDGRSLAVGAGVGESVVITSYQHPLLFATFGLGQYARALTQKKGFAA